MFISTLLEKLQASFLTITTIGFLLLVPQDGLERRGYKEAGFLNALTEVVRTGK